MGPGILNSVEEAHDPAGKQLDLFGLKVGMVIVDLKLNVGTVSIPNSECQRHLIMAMGLVHAITLYTSIFQEPTVELQIIEANFVQRLCLSGPAERTDNVADRKTLMSETIFLLFTYNLN